MNDGVISTTIASGFDSSSQVSITHSSQFGSGVSTTVSVNLLLLSIKHTTSISASVSDSKTTSELKTTSTSVSSTVRIKPVVGEVCFVRLHFETCSLTSEGSVPIVGTGFVWFELAEKTKGRTRVAYSLEMVLSEKERSVPIALTIAIDTKANGKFDSNCECTNAACQTLHSGATIDANGAAINSINSNAGAILGSDNDVNSPADAQMSVDANTD